MATGLPAGFGIITQDAKGNPISAAERAKLIKEEAARMAAKTDESFDYARDFGGFFGTVANNVLGNPGKVTERPVYDTPKDAIKDVMNFDVSTGGRSERADLQPQNGIMGMIGSIGFIVLGIIFVVLALLMTSGGQQVVKKVASRGLA